MRVFEVTASGFDASSDETDGHVFWVKAESESEVLAVIDGTGAKFCNEIDAGSDVDFVLPGDAGKLRDALIGLREKQESQPPSKTLDEMKRTKSYFPFRHVFAFKQGDEWFVCADLTRRRMNNKARAGLPVFLLG